MIWCIWFPGVSFFGFVLMSLLIVGFWLLSGILGFACLFLNLWVCGCFAGYTLGLSFASCCMWRFGDFGGYV